MLSLLIIIVATATATTPTMNSIPYIISNPTPTTPTTIPFHGEFFEVNGPETITKYSQVYWKSQPVELPEHIISRFDNKVMAVTGMEVNIVRTNANGTISSAPAYELYNHHYSGWMYGKDAAPKNTQTGSDDNPQPSHPSHPSHPSQQSATAPIAPMAHGQPLPQWIVTKSNMDSISVDYPNVQAFSEGNGNEHRGAYKGYAKSFAQLIKSPKTWANNPMIINTNKRLTDDMSPGYISRLVPKHSLAPEDSTYSGILECPCTDRKIKVFDGYTKSSKECSSTVVTPSTMNECYVAVQKMGMSPVVSNSTVIASSSCTVNYNKTLLGWNVGFDDQDCTSSSSSSDGNDGSDGSDGSASGEDATPHLLGSARSVFINNDGDDDNNDDNDDNISFVQVSIEIQQNTVQIVMSGPTNKWYAAAFNASTMSDTPYAIVVNGTGHVEERMLGNHAAGAICTTPSIKVISDHVDGKGRRTVAMERPTSSLCYSFDHLTGTTTTIPMLLAHGTTPTFSYHGKTRASTLLTLIEQGSTLCVCRDPTSNAGTIDGIVFDSKVCAPYPTSELLTTQNAICNISRYEGGLYCCHHDSILLDKHQKVPEKTDTWHLKYRFYFEEFTSNSTHDSHQNLFRTWWSTEATNNEYDVPKSTANCLNPLTSPKDCVYVLKSQFQGRDMISGKHGGGGSQCMVSGDPAACGNVSLIEQRDGGKFQLMYMAAHCHTPACMSLELWNDDTGELICRNAPIYGNGTAPLDEMSYIISIPPCLFGSKEEGLQPPPVLSLNSNLTTIKRANNTNGHWGVMALWQMRAAYIGGNPPSWRK
jgi:hypothetical protein